MWVSICRIFLVGECIGVMASDAESSLIPRIVDSWAIIKKDLYGEQDVSDVSL